MTVNLDLPLAERKCDCKESGSGRGLYHIGERSEPQGLLAPQVMKSLRKREKRALLKKNRRLRRAWVHPMSAAVWRRSAAPWRRYRRARRRFGGARRRFGGARRRLGGGTAALGGGLAALGGGLAALGGALATPRRRPPPTAAPTAAGRGATAAAAALERRRPPPNNLKTSAVARRPDVFRENLHGTTASHLRAAGAKGTDLGHLDAEQRRRF